MIKFQFREDPYFRSRQPDRTRFRIPSAFTLISTEAKNMPDALQLNCQDFSNFKENATLSRINLRNADSGFFIQCFAFHSKMRSS